MTKNASEDGSCPWDPLHMWETWKKFPSSWLWPGPTPGIAAICRINQLMEDLSLWVQSPKHMGYLLLSQTKQGMNGKWSG